MLSCKEIVEQASRNIDAELVWHEKMGFKMHLMMCKTCSRYAKQLRFIQQATIVSNEKKQANDTIQLPIEARKRISEVLSKH